MAVCTKGLLNGRVIPEEILNFITQKYDKNAISRVETQDYEDFSITSGFIYFKSSNGISRSLFYYYYDKEDISRYEYLCKKGLKEFASTKTTSLSIGYNQEGVEIMTEIVAEFGGLIDKNDCDDITFEPVIKTSDDTIKPVIHVSLNDVYEKFGCIVIIDK